MTDSAQRLELAERLSRGTLFLRLNDGPARPSTELKEAEKQLILAALRSSALPETGDAAHWKERHDSVLQKHIECCGRPSPDGAVREALKEVTDELRWCVGQLEQHGYRLAPAGHLPEAIAKADFALSQPPQADGASRLSRPHHSPIETTGETDGL